MANPKFWFYPSPDGLRLFEIDLGEPLAELYSEFDVDSATAVGLDGSMYRTTGVHREVVTIQRDRMKLGEDLAVKFQALQNHLDRGFSCAFANDPDKAYCFPVTMQPSSGDHQVFLGGDPFRQWTGGAVAAEKDFVVIESQNPQLLYEQKKVQAFTSSTPTATISSSLGGTLNLSPAIAFSHNAAAWCRHYRFFPILKRPQKDVGKAIITNEGGRLFSLNITLVIDYQTLFSHHPDVGDYVTQEPEWGGAAPAWTGVAVFPESESFRVNLDNADPRWADRDYGHPGGAQSGAGNLVYPSKPGAGLPK